MAISLSRQTAQKIVDTVKDICGQDINFINTSGVIFASTNSDRIGDFHEIGKKVVETEQTIEVATADSFYGTHPGINIPFIYNRKVFAVIGISGNPDEVRKYAVLAQQITSLILREQEIDSFNYGKKNQMNYVIRSLVDNSEINHDFLVEYLQEHQLQLNTTCRTVVIKLNGRYNLANLSLIEAHIYQAFEQITTKLYTFIFPNEYVLILPEKQYQRWSYIFTSLSNNYKSIFHIGIGNSCFLSKQSESYAAAHIAIHSLDDANNIAVFDDLDIEILLGCVNERTKEKYLQKTISNLNQDDLNLLETYFSTDMSLKDTADILFLHKNTLQYKLNRIQTITGYNPRAFRDATILYMAVRLCRT